MEFRKKLLLYMCLTASVGERRKQSHCLTVYLANGLKHGAAGSPARWKQHVKQTTLRNRGIMIFQHLKNTLFYVYNYRKHRLCCRAFISYYYIFQFFLFPMIVW